MTHARAGLWPRVGAFAWDYIPIAAYLCAMVGLGALINAVAPSLARALFGNPVAGEATGFLLVTLPISLYFALSEASTRRATWGKRKKGLTVVRSDGERLSGLRSIGRTALKFIPWELAHACIWQLRFAGAEPSPVLTAGLILVWVLVGANVVSLLVNEQGQTLYDLLAGTVVVPSRVR